MSIFEKNSPYLVITKWFIITILIGTILLWLPISHNENINVSFIDAFFTAVCSICVTGMSTLELASTFNIFGKTIIAILIQIGGVGIICAATFLFIISGQKIGIKKRLLIMNSFNLTSLKGVVKFVIKIFKITLLIELIGAILSFFIFYNNYKLLKAIELSVFHSISSFNNAGFDIIGSAQNLVPYKDNIFMLLITSSLTLLGGIGFIVIFDILDKKSFKKLQLHSKIVLKTTLSMLFIGTILIKSTSNLTLLESSFLSISATTAGFYTIPINMLGTSSLLIIMILMFIGSSPGSTGGGIKTTTFYTIFKSSISMCTNRDCSSFKRKIPQDTINKSMSILFLGVATVLITTLLLSVTEAHLNLTDILFESVSAFGTIGLSTGITPSLSIISKMILSISMFIGRIGPLTLLAIWSEKGKSNVSYPEENIMIG